MSNKREEILNILKTYKNEYIDIRIKLIDYLNRDEFKKNVELNELTHIKLYEINKIIAGFEKNIKNLENDNVFKSNEERIYDFFNNKFLEKLKEIIINVKYQISVIENNIN